MNNQYVTFRIKNLLFGINVIDVQEITKNMHITPVRKANKVICGLINLRGQISTAIDLSLVFEMGKINEENFMTVVCSFEGDLYSLIVDAIGEVITLPESEIKKVPDSISAIQKSILDGVYETENGILSIVKIDQLIKTISNHNFGGNAWQQVG